MPSLNLLVMPAGTMTSLTVNDDFYFRLNPNDFAMLPVKSQDIRVQNLPTRDDIWEISLTEFDNLQEAAFLYDKMANNIDYYRKISSQGVVDFLTTEILSASFPEQMPAIFEHFDFLASVYHNKINQPTFALAHEKNKQVFLLRPKFVLSVLQAYFEQEFVITQANISQEKFANASFFDGSSEFRVNVTVADVVVPITTTGELRYDFAPIIFDIAGKYQPNVGYQFELQLPKLLNEAVFSADKQLQANKSQYLTKILKQSHTIDKSQDLSSVLQQAGQTFRASEAERLDKQFK